MPGMTAPGELPDTSLDALAARALALVRDGRRAVLGVTGAPGAGTTTLVEQLLAVLPAGSVAHVPMDGFHLADVELERLGRRGRKGAPDTFDVAGYVATLRRIRDDGSEVVYAPGFERTLDQPIAASIAVRPAARLVVTEGNYLLHGQDGWDQLADVLDEVWYVDLPDDERLARLVARHASFGKATDEAAAWAHGSDQANALLVQASRERADLVVLR